MNELAFGRSPSNERLPEASVRMRSAVGPRADLSGTNYDFAHLSHERPFKRLLAIGLRRDPTPLKVRAWLK